MYATGESSSFFKYSGPSLRSMSISSFIIRQSKMGLSSNLLVHKIPLSFI